MNPPGAGPRFSIDQAMIVTFIVAICLAPVIVAMRSQHGERVLGAIVFDILVLPACGTLAVALLMKPGPRRAWCMKAFLLTPLIFFFAVLMIAVPFIIFVALILP